MTKKGFSYQVAASRTEVDHRIEIHEFTENADATEHAIAASETVYRLDVGVSHAVAIVEPIFGKNRGVEMEVHSQFTSLAIGPGSYGLLVAVLSICLKS